MNETDNKPQPASPGLRMVLDYGPLIVFFAVNFLTPGLPIVRVLAATAAFMVAMVIAMLVSWIKTRHISPMLWMTGALVIVFGGLTLYFHDQRFIQMKPTFVYALFAGVLTFGLATGRPLLQQLLGTAYPGLDADGWRKLTRNWAIFFALMAILNEAVWRTTAAVMAKDAAWNAWVFFKFPGCVIITFLFALANIPMLLKHGLTLEKDAVPEVPPEG